VGGEQEDYSKTFANLKDAITWQANFHPSLPDVVVKNICNRGLLEQLAINFMV